MHLSAHYPNIQDPVALLLAVAEALEQLHQAKQAHGSLSRSLLGDCLGPHGNLDVAKLKATAAEPEPVGSNPFLHDVRCFVNIAIETVTGPAAAPDAPFQAGPYFNKGWPNAFLQLLEEFNPTEAGVASLTMSDLVQTLRIPRPSRIHSQPSIQTASPVTSAITPTLTHASLPPRTRVTSPAIHIALRNATVGKPYKYEPGMIAAAIAAQLGHDPLQARVTHLQLPEDCGLFFDKMTGSLCGTPTRTFDEELSLDYVPSQSARSIQGKVTLLINPDPITLWKDLPPSPKAPYQKPTVDHSDDQLGSFRVVAASRRGRSHANRGEFRDDDYAVGYAPETGWLIVAVADGAGSAIYSRRGSQVASRAARDRLTAVLNSAEHNQAEALYLQHLDWEHPSVRKALRRSLYEAALIAHHKLRDEVRTPNEFVSPPPVLRNYDTTLVLLAIKLVEQGCIAATFSIGDGGAGILPRPTEGIPLTHADLGEHAGQTLFLTFESTVADTEENLEGRFNFMLTVTFAGAVVMTDGITDPKFPSDGAFADPAQWAALWAELRAPLSSSTALLDWMNFLSPGNHDDRTLVAVLPVQATDPANP